MNVTSPRIVEAGGIAIGNHLPFVLIAGPCQIESRAHALEMAAALKAAGGIRQRRAYPPAGHARSTCCVAAR